MTMEGSGWCKFDDETSLFIYDFFTHKLNNYDKLVFYSYYINDMTLDEIGERCMCSFQAVGTRILRINNKINKAWTTRKMWIKNVS